jgi:hypothetical protein
VVELHHVVGTYGVESPKECPREVKAVNFEKVQVNLPCEAALKNVRSNQFLENYAMQHIFFFTENLFWKLFTVIS